MISGGIYQGENGVINGSVMNNAIGHVQQRWPIGITVQTNLVRYNGVSSGLPRLVTPDGLPI
jgi:hypothetical protein